MAGTVVLTTHSKLGSVRALLITCTGDGADGSFPTLDLPSIEGRLLALETNPGATAPTASYDITLIDDEGHDVLEGVGANRHTSNTEKAAIVYSSTSLHPAVDEWQTLALTLANNSVNDAIVVVTIFYTPGV